MSIEKAYPLAWPIGWPRTSLPRSNENFAERSVHAALEELKRQLELLKATNLVISSNFTLGATPKDRGVCVYFQLRGKPYALPCDRWDAVEDNLWALAKHIEALRGQERWGVGTLERAFAGYIALPAPAGENPAEWWKILKCDRSASIETAQQAYRQRAIECHPDRGGSDAAMALLNAAWAEARKGIAA